MQTKSSMQYAGCFRQLSDSFTILVYLMFSSKINVSLNLLVLPKPQSESKLVGLMIATRAEALLSICFSLLYIL